MEQRTWTGAIGEVWRSATRHKVISTAIALCVAGSLAGIALAGQRSSAAPTRAAAPTFSLPALGQSGQKITLADYSGKPLIVNFFASWCEVCKQETPLLAGFYRSERGKMPIVGLDENDMAGNAISFTRAEGVGYPVGWDPGGSAATAYGVAALPQTFFLNARHQIVHRVFGAVTLADLHKGIELATAAG